MFRSAWVVFFSLLGVTSVPSQELTPALGLFEGQNDVGDVLHPGSTAYASATRHYLVSGSGENMWFANDQFHFVWKKISSEDLTLTATISILGNAVEGHRKAVLMIRQSLDADSAYVDAALHGDGLTSLQFRERQGDTTREVESNVSGPATLRIQKQGDHFYLWLAAQNRELQFAGGSARVQLHPPFYVGIGVCAHQKEALEKVEFTDVNLNTNVAPAKASYSTIETVLKSGDARVAYVSTQRLRNAGFSPDGHAITFEVAGRAQQTPFAPLKTAAPIGDPIPNPESPIVLNCVTDCELRLTSPAGDGGKILTTFSGDKMSLGLHPWSPDGRRAAFISYQSLQ